MILWPRSGDVCWTLGQLARTFGLRPGLSGWGKFELGHDRDELGERVRFHLLHDFAAVQFDGAFRQVQVGGDLLVQSSGDDQRKHLALAGCERLGLFPPPGEFCVFSPALTVTLD